MTKPVSSWLLTDILSWIMSVGRAQSVPVENLHLVCFLGLTNVQLVNLTELEFSTYEPRIGRILYAQLRSLLSKVSGSPAEQSDVKDGTVLDYSIKKEPGLLQSRVPDASISAESQDDGRGAQDHATRKERPELETRGPSRVVQSRVQERTTTIDAGINSNPEEALDLSGSRAETPDIKRKVRPPPKKDMAIREEVQKSKNMGKVPGPSRKKEVAENQITRSR